MDLKIVIFTQNSETVESTRKSTTIKISTANSSNERKTKYTPTKILVFDLRNNKFK